MEDRTPTLILPPEIAAIQAARERLERALITGWVGLSLVCIAAYALVLRLAQ